jgi:hypothetical protein
MDPPYLPHAAVFAYVYAPAGEPRPVGVVGWVLVRKEWSAAAPLAVVVVKGNEVVPARVAYLRLTGVEPLFGTELACAAFQVVIPAGVFDRPEHVRLFAVPTRPGEPVIEVTTGR